MILKKEKMRLIPPLIFLNLTDPGTQYLGFYYQRGKHNTPELSFPLTEWLTAFEMVVDP